MPDFVIPPSGGKAMAELQSAATGTVRPLMVRGLGVAAAALIHSWMGPLIILTELGVVLLQELVRAAVVLTAVFGSETYSTRANTLLRQEARLDTTEGGASEMRPDPTEAEPATADRPVL
jgi:hypothetical protein